MYGRNPQLEDNITRTRFLISDAATLRVKILDLCKRIDCENPVYDACVEDLENNVVRIEECIENLGRLHCKMLMQDAEEDFYPPTNNGSATEPK